MNNSTCTTEYKEVGTEKKAVRQDGLRFSHHVKNALLSDRETVLRALMAVGPVHPSRMALLPPTSNTGVRNSHRVPDDQWQATTIDWLSFTIPAKHIFEFPEDEALLDQEAKKQHSDMDAAWEYEVFAQTLLNECLGLELGKIHDKGRNFYRKSADICSRPEGGEPEYIAGAFIAYTGNGGIQFNLPGTACDVVQLGKGWKKLFAVLSMIPGVALTRVDVALDAIGGEFTIEDAEAAYARGDFKANTRGKMPKASMITSDYALNKGRTFKVGTRSSGKVVRTYEKGYQMGDEYSPWVRCEAELHNKQRHLPLDILLDHDSYFAGCCPWLEKLLILLKPRDEVPAPRRIATKIANKCMLEYKTLTKYAEKQYGKLFGFMKTKLQMTENQIVCQLIRLDGVPRRLDMSSVVMNC